MGRPSPSKDNRATKQPSGESAASLGALNPSSSHSAPQTECFSDHLRDEPVAVRFVRQARRLAEADPERSASVPWSPAYPTYDDLDEAQLRWYLHWRGQVRRGSYPDTDLLYLLLYVYELINGVGIIDSENGFEQLLRLWHRYAGTHPQLSLHLPDWIEDYALVHRLPNGLERARAALAEAWAATRYPDFVIEHYSRRRLLMMPLRMVSQLAGWDITGSSLARAGYSRLVSLFVRLALDAVDEAVQRKYGRGIFAIYGPRANGVTRRLAYAGAVFAGEPIEVTVPQSPRYEESAELQSVFSSVVRYTENALHQATGYPQRLRGESIDEMSRAAIEALVGQQFPQSQRLFLEFLPLDDRPAPSAPPAGPAGALVDLTATHAPAQATSAVPSAEPSGLPAALLPTTRSRFSSHQLAVLRILLESSEPMGAIRQISSDAGQMPELLLDSINETATKIFGDAVLDLTGPPRIYEEYRQEVAALVASHHAGG